MKFLLFSMRTRINSKLFFLFLWMIFSSSLVLAEWRAIGENDDFTSIVTPTENDDCTITTTVIVTKSDGCLQYYPDASIGLDQMAEEQLAGIDILSSSKQHDGLIGNLPCGGETDWLNTYEINIEDLEEAKKRGFSQWPYSYYTARVYGNEMESYGEAKTYDERSAAFISESKPFIITNNEPFISEGKAFIIQDQPSLVTEDNKPSDCDY